MYIKDIFAQRKPVISFEIFPPKKDGSIEAIYSTLDGLKDLKPDYISVTYGAGGSTKDRTLEIASLIKHKYGVEALAHLTCITSTKEEIGTMLSQLAENDIHNVLTLRGDLPQEADFEFPNPLHYNYACDLVKEVKNRGGFSIGAACYPEVHPECDDMQKDLDHLKAKVEAGADFLITQLFFDNELFYDFLDKTKAMGINLPVTVGVMPALNKNQIHRMTSLTGASVPPKLARMMDKYEHSPEALKEAGIAFATEQIIDLLSWGVDGIHLYTMNRPEVTREITMNISTIRDYLTRN